MFSPHMSLSRRDMHIFQWCQYSKTFVSFLFCFQKWKFKSLFELGARKEERKAFYYIQTQLHWLLNLKLFICSLMCPGIRWNAFCLDIVKVLNKFAVWFYWFSPKCQSSVFNPIHDSLAVYRWQTFITELETMENVLQLVHKVAVSALCCIWAMVILSVWKPLIRNENYLHRSFSNTHNIFPTVSTEHTYAFSDIYSVVCVCLSFWFTKYIRVFIKG